MQNNNGQHSLTTAQDTTNSDIFLWRVYNLKIPTIILKKDYFQLMLSGAGCGATHSYLEKHNMLYYFDQTNMVIPLFLKLGKKYLRIRLFRHFGPQRFLASYLIWPFFLFNSNIADETYDEEETRVLPIKYWLLYLLWGFFLTLYVMAHWKLICIW